MSLRLRVSLIALALFVAFVYLSAQGANPPTQSFTVGVGGVTQYTLVQTDTATNTLIVAAPGASNRVYGIATQTVSAGGSVAVGESGPWACLTDTGGAVEGHLVIQGTGTVDYCKDSGQTLSLGISSATQIIGVFRTSAPAGATALVNLTPAQFGTAGGLGSVASVFGRAGTVTAQSGDYSAAQISGLAASATTDTTNASNIANGTLNAARLPATATQTIASGTSALGTSAISSAACATAVTTTATGTATTDAVIASFNGDPTAVTGYIPATAGMLTIVAYPTANNVNFKVCNNTSASITPGAITLNWRVVR
jgi:hypothetical protein